MTLLITTNNTTYIVANNDANNLTGGACDTAD